MQATWILREAGSFTARILPSRVIRVAASDGSRRPVGGEAWNNVEMAVSTRREPVTAGERDSSEQFLRHVMLVGGTLRDWSDMSAPQWSERVDALGGVADVAGASFLTVRAFEPGDDPVDLESWERRVGHCRVLVDPCSDGRERFAEAMRRLPAGEPVNEATVVEMLYAPADVEPDLILVLGEPDRLPPSLVWELAYSELVFHPTAWADLTADHLVTAIADFAKRERRFGGLDEHDG
mgnify:FL=1